MNFEPEDFEPKLSPDDTQPRPRLVPPSAEELPLEERRGCGNPLLIVTIALILIGFFVVTVGFAAWAGWRDGTVARKTQNAVALVGTLDSQATLAWSDLSNQQYELGEQRCQYIATLDRFNIGARNCMSTAEAMLSATPTPTITPTLAATLTPIASATTIAPTIQAGANSTTQLFDLAQNAIRNNDYETAQSYLEALRGKDSTFRKSDVEDMLVSTYLQLADEYEAQGRLSEMLVVVERAQSIRDLGADTKWTPTAITEIHLYMDAKGYLDVQSYAQAAKVFHTLLDMQANYLDTRTLACQTFTKANDTTAIVKYKC